MRRELVAAALGYVIGTFPSADIATRLAPGGTADLRDEGSGNPGATNAANVLGKQWGAFVLVVDIAKGFIAGRVGRRLAGDTGIHVGSTAAVVGHCLPVWNGFRGGKGVATSVGQVLVSFPTYAPINAAVAIATGVSKRWKRRAFAAAMVASAAWIASSTIWAWRRWPNLWGPAPTLALPAAAVVSTAVIYSRFASAEGPDDLAPEAQE